MGLATNPHYACEVTLQPVDRYPLDAAILFSDILTVPDAMGLGLYFEAGEGPRFTSPVTCKADVDKLPIPDPEDELGYVMNAVRTIRRELKGEVPLIGFSGSPFTLACYMVEGGSSANYRKVKEMMYRRPDLFNAILEKNTDAVIAYLNAQIDSGVDAVMVFDTWGGTLSHETYLQFSLPCLKRIVNSVKRERHGQKIPTIVFTKGCAPWIKEISEIGADAMGVDWTVSLGEVRALTQDRVSLQGNLDPSVLFAGTEVVREQARKVIEDFGQVSNGGHVFNLGHGIDKDTDPEVVAALVDEVHSYSRKFHSR